MSDAPRPLSLLPPLAAPAQAAAFADVAVDLGGRGPDQLFTYTVPAALASGAVPGRRVRVPFAQRGDALGVIVSVQAGSELPLARLRPLLQLLDAGPALREVDMACARWLAERTLCPLAQALHLLLPPDKASALVEAVYHPAVAAEAATAVLRRAPTQAAAWREIARWPGSSLAELGRRGVRPAAVAQLLRRGLVSSGPRAVRRDPFAAMGTVAVEQAPELTEAQAAALRALAPALDGPAHQRFLLWGVTGSGKTEVYLRAIERVLAHGRQAVVLVPEIALTPQTVRVFRARFGDRVAVLHSALGSGERHDEWWRIRRGEVGVAVGARSAVFAPFPRLGLIVVDEEHESSYKQEEAPRYHARDVAAWRAQQHGIPLLLGSATPDLQTFQAAADGALLRLDLPARVASRPLPEVRTVDLREADPRRLLAADLVSALQRHLGAGHQAVLFLNRRGFAPVLLCAACGYSARCQACSVHLCYHAADGALCCHYCGARQGVPTLCPRCGGHLLRLRGGGTERVAQEVADLFPDVRVLRMDVDTTRTRGAHQRIYEAFRSRRAQVLVGTQMVAKGWDVAGVTLVGVIDADTGLHLPDYRGAERTFQLLCQVAGRAGRGEDPGEVLIQTRVPDHYAVVAAGRHDYAGFAQRELATRQAAGFPPFGHLLRLVCSAPDAAATERAAGALVAALTPLVPAGVDLWGPSQAPLARLRGRHRWHVALRGPDGAQLRALTRQALAQAERRLGEVRVAVDPDPLQML